MIFLIWVKLIDLMVLSESNVDCLKNTTTRVGKKHILIHVEHKHSLKPHISHEHH